MVIDENHMATKIHQKFKNNIMESTILDSFTKLSTDTNRERIDGGQRLLKHLSETHDNEKNDKEFNYVLNRLVRGLGSSRINARKGFYMTLVALLKTSLVSCKDVVEIIKKHLQMAGSSSKSEEADLFMGQILAIGALIKSGKLTTASYDEQKELIQQLVTAGKKRSFLTLCSYAFLIEFLNNITEDVFSQSVWPIMKSEVLKAWNEQNLDQMWFLLIAEEKFPGHVTSKILKKTFNSSEIIHSSTVQNICELLMNIPSLISIQHPVYKIISTKLAKSPYLVDFCHQMNLQLNKYNRNKFITYMTIVNYILEDLEAVINISELFVVNFMQACLKIIPPIKTRKDDEVISKFHQLLETLNKKLADSTIKCKIKMSILKKFLFYPGTFMFEKMTNTKIIQQITLNLNVKGVKQLSKLYADVILANESKMIGENEQEHWYNVERIHAAHSLNRLLNHSAMQHEHEWRMEQVKFFLNLALFNTENSNIGIELAAVLKETFYRSLDQKLPKLEDLQSFLSQLVHHINSQISDTDSTNKLRHPLSDKALERWQTMLKLIEKLEKKKKKSGSIPVFHTLLLYMGLYLFANEKIAMNAIDELQSCYTRAKSKKKPDEELVEGAVENEPLWIEVMIDLFLSLLSQEDHLSRRIINYVFPYLCPYLTLTAVHQILNVLDPESDSHPLLDSDAEDDDENDETKDDEETKDDKVDKSDDETDMSDIDDYDEEPVNDKLRMAIREALGNSGMQTDEESVDVDDIDEEEGKRLDRALATAFKSVKTSKNKKKQTKNERILTHFRVRVLDLIELYLNSEPSLEIVLEIIVALLKTLEFSIKDVHQAPLERRLRACFNKLPALKKFQSMDGVKIKNLSILLKSLLLDQDATNRTVFKTMGDVITKCCIFIIQIVTLIPNRKNKAEQVVHSLVNDSFCQFFEKRDCLIPSLIFNELFKLTWDGNWLLVPLAIQYAFDSNIRPFRRNQALSFLITFYKNGRLLKSELSAETKLKFSEIEQQLTEKTIEFLENFARNSSENRVKEKFICLLMTLLRTINNCHRQHKIDCVIDWNQIGKVISNLRSNVSLAKDAKSAYNKLCSVIGISKKVTSVSKNQEEKTSEAVQNGVGNSSSESENENDENTETTKEKKKLKKKRQKARAMKKETQQLKKQTKLLRMQAMEKGLEDVSFSQISNLDEISSDVGSVGSDEEEQSQPAQNKRENKKKRKHVVDDVNERNQLKSKKKKIK